MNQLTRVIGVGSRHGDDQAGWLVATRLAALPQVDADVITVLNPIDMLANMSDCQKLIVVDAARSEQPVGGVRRLRWPADAIDLASSHSSHGVGVAYVLKLAELQGSLPEHVVVFALDCGAPRESSHDDVPDDRVLRRVYEATRQIRAELKLNQERAHA